MKSAPGLTPWAVFILISVASAVAQHRIADISVGGTPTGIAANPRTNMVYVSNASFGVVTVIDGATNTVLTNVNTGGMPRDIGVYLPTNQVYVYDETGILSIIDGNTNKVVKTASLPFAISAIARLGQSKWLYAADFVASLVRVIDLTTLEDVADIPVVASPFYIAANPVAKLVYVSNASASTDGAPISVIDTTTNTVVNSFDLGSEVNVWAMSADPVHNLLYAVTSVGLNTGHQFVTVLNATTGTVLGSTVDLGAAFGILALPQQNKAVVTGGKLPPPKKYVENLIFIDGSTFQVSGILRVGQEPWPIGFNQTTSRIYVGNDRSGTVTVIGN